MDRDKQEIVSSCCLVTLLAFGVAVTVLVVALAVTLL